MAVQPKHRGGERSGEEDELQQVAGERERGAAERAAAGKRVDFKCSYPSRISLSSKLPISHSFPLSVVFLPVRTSCKKVLRAPLPTWPFLSVAGFQKNSVCGLFM